MFGKLEQDDRLRYTEYMILLIHITISLLTVAAATSSVITINRSMMRATPLLLAGTILSGIALLLADPTVSMLHLCASGLVLSAVTIILHRLAIRRLQAV